MRKDWETKTWNEVLSIINGKNQKNVEDSNGIYPIYGSGGIMGYANDFLCPNNTVIIGRKGNINKPIFVEEKFWNVDTAFGLVPKEGILVAKYLFYYCVNYDFEKLNKAVTIPSLTKSDLLKIKIALPPLETQQQIVEELDCLTSIIEKQKKQLEELDNLAQSIFYDMFGNTIENEKEWNVEKLGDVCKIQNGFAFKSTLFREQGLPILRISNIQNDVITLDNIVYFSKSDYNADLDRFKVYPGDIVIALSGATTGKIGVNRTDLTFYLNQRVALCRETDSIIKGYLFHYLRTKTVELLSMAGGAAQPNLSTNQIQQLFIPVPPLSLQHQFASKIEAIEKQKELIKKSIKETEDLFNSRMDYYFN